MKKIQLILAGSIVIIIASLLVLLSQTLLFAQLDASQGGSN